MQTNTFIFVWDMYGLEACIDLTELEHNNLLDVLKDKPSNNINTLLNGILLRAKFNSQRHYEIYSCQVDHNITRTDLVQMFAKNPQKSAELIRSYGHAILDDRVDKAKIVIT